LETAAEVAAGVRADLAEGRKKLRELADAEKESRKLKRAAMLALATVRMGARNCGGMGDLEGTGARMSGLQRFAD
jgi:hypothetical protein